MEREHSVSDYTKRCAIIREKLMDKDVLERLQKAAPRGVVAENYAQLIVNACGRDTKLLSCTPMSIQQAAMDSIALGLPVSSTLGYGYLVPYKGRAQFQAGYQGYLKLAFNDGRATHAAAEVVYKGDEKFEYRLGTSPFINHVPMIGRSRGREMFAAYGIVSVINGPPFVAVASIADLDDHAEQYIQKDRSGNISDSALYKTNPVAWYKKTMLKRALKYVPLSSTARDILNTEDWIEQGLDLPNSMESGDEQTTANLRAALGLPVAETTPTQETDHARSS